MDNGQTMNKKIKEAVGGNQQPQDHRTGRVHFTTPRPNRKRATPAELLASLASAIETARRLPWLPIQAELPPTPGLPISWRLPARGSL